jgi:starch synthase
MAGLGPRAHAFDDGESCNPLAGAIRLADRVIAVSPSYAAEILQPGAGAGLEAELAARSEHLTGIRNGIDTSRWSTATDELIPANFTARDLAGREVCQKELRRHVGFDGPTPANRGPLIGMVARLAAQKGVDLALELVPLLETLPAQLVLIGDGDPALAAAARAVQSRHPDRFWFAPYDDVTAHLIAAGSDLMLVPSRFEPCGLTQMEAMAYGAIPVVTAVGGLRDTVIDADRSPSTGTGFVAAAPAAGPLVDALHRAVRALRTARRRSAIQRRGMLTDWSWAAPAQAHLELYESILA